MSEARPKSRSNPSEPEEAGQKDMNAVHMTEIDINQASSDSEQNYDQDHEEEDYDEEAGTEPPLNLGRSNDVDKENADLRTARTETPEDSKEDMEDKACRSPAAQLSVRSNGEASSSHEEAFQQDLSHGDSSPGPVPSAHTHNVTVNHGATTEGVVEVGPYTGWKNQMNSSPVSPSPAAASRLARSVSSGQVETDTGGAEEQQGSTAMVLSDDLKSPALEKLELVRKWSINTYKCTKQILSEKLGRGSRTVDLDLEARIDVLRDNKRKYEQVVKLAQTLANQLAQMMQTQRQLGDAFADLSVKTPELHEEFGFNAETQKLLSKNGETLLGAINFFISNVNTLVDKTIEDTMINIKQYEAARIEYDAYRTDLEELNLGPRDPSTLPKLEQSQVQFQTHREKYEKMRNDVSVKLKFLEENKVKVLHNQLVLFHNAVAAYFSGNQQHLEQTLKQFHIKLKMPGADVPSWLEER